MALFSLNPSLPSFSFSSFKPAARVTLLMAAGILAGCGEDSAVKPDDGFARAYQDFSIDSFKQHVKTLSSDAFGGRAPASKGDKMTRDYLVNAFKAAGLKPGNNGSYLQEVKIVGITGEVTEPLSIGHVSFDFGKNYVAGSRKNKTTRTLDKSDLVFVGYGINAPEYHWNDYAGIDVKGKTVVILVNDPGYVTGSADLFEGKVMTYYGRWTYKYEEAARQGASGAIIVHQSGPAGYGWNVIESSWTGTQFYLPSGNSPQPALDVEMWVSLEKAKAVFADAGLNFEQLEKQAAKPGFKAVDMGISASVALKNTIEQTVTYNVVATLPGSKRPDEHVMYMGHIDHLGQDPKLDGDQVYNGAHDNASGIAGLIEIAKAYGSLNPKPERSVTFVGVAAEEQGTLGSQAYAEHPTVPLKNIVGLINMDSLNIAGRKKDVTVVGLGKSELEKVLEKAAKHQGRYLAKEAHPERGYYYRSDHFSLAKKGVPALSAGGGEVPLNAEEAKINEKIGAYIAKCYHQTCDEYRDDWGWAGVKENLQLYFETGYLLADSNNWPNWYPGSEFKALRDAMR